MEQEIGITSVPLKPAIIRFAIAFVGMALALGLVTVVLNFDAPSGMGMAVLFSAAYYTIAKFIEEHRRAPLPNEKRALLWRTWLVATLIQMAILPLIAHTLSLGLVLFVIAFVCLLTWAALAIAYSDWMTTRLLAGIEKREARKRSKWR